MGYGRIVSGVLGWAVASLLPVGLIAQAKSIEASASDIAESDAGLAAAAQGAIGKALFLRCLCKADSLSFDVNGRLDQGSKSQRVDWTLAGVDVAKAKRTGPERIELDGTRAAVRWNDAAKNFDRKSLKMDSIRVVLNGATDVASVKKALASVFAVGIDPDLQAETPNYWRHYFNPSMPWPADGVNPATLLTVGNKLHGVEVPAPAMGKKSSAMYTAEARRDRVEGSVVLLIVVDEHGTKPRIRIVQPLGYGLDAEAVEAAEKTQFLPSTIDGHPIAVQFLLKETFSIAETPANF